MKTIHIIIGISVLYVTIFRLIWKFLNPNPTSSTNAFKGQTFIAKANHFLLYVSILLITSSGILKKLYMGEVLNFFLFKFGLKDTNFKLADSFYQIHIWRALRSDWQPLASGREPPRYSFFFQLAGVFEHPRYPLSSSV